MKKILVPAAVALIAAVSANAQTLGTPPTVPAYPGVPVNAYGHIDSSQSTYSQTTVGLDTLTLALDVTPHFSASSVIPPVNTLGVGKYGVSAGLGADGRSFWNYDFAITSSSSLLATYNLTLTILNVGNGQSISFNPAAILDNNVIVNGLGTTIGNSESLDFTINDPSGFFGKIGYNPNAADTYDITLTAQDVTGATVASLPIEVTSSVPDATSTMGLMSASIAALGLLSRRFRK